MLRWEMAPKAKVEKRESGVSFVLTKHNLIKQTLHTLTYLLVIICQGKAFHMECYNDVLVVLWIQF